MKQYGINKSTEFTKKQISVLYFKAKNGELKIEKWFLNDLYALAEYYWSDDNRSVEYSEKDVLKILESVFNGEIEAAQVLINETENKWFNLYGKKEQAKRNREQFVA